MEENKGFVVDVKVMICLPMDGKKYCIPSDEGLHLLHNQEIPICDQRALVNFKSMTSKKKHTLCNHIPKCTFKIYLINPMNK